MAQSELKKDNEETVRLQNDLRRLTKKIERQKHLEIRLNETLHSLRVHQEELRTQNEDLLTAQTEITRSQRKYRDLFDFAPIGYFLVDTSGIIREVNLTAANMLGRHRDVIGGKPMFLFIPATYRQVLQGHLRELWTGHAASAEVALTKADGEIVPVELFSVPVENDQGRITQSRIAVTDISKRRKAEDALKESERRLEAIVKNIPDIVYRLDQNGKINFISESIRRYGYAPEDLLGRPMVHLIHPRDREKARRRIDERRTGDRSTSGLELRIRPRNTPPPQQNEADPGERYFSVNAEGLYAGNNQGPGHFIGTQGIAHDITKRKQGELDRLHLEAELHKARKMEAIGTLAGGIAHDFNNLLMGIQGSVSLIRLDMDGAEADQCLLRLENIQQCVKRGSDLTQQLLGFAKRGKYNVRAVDINRIVAETAELFGRTHKNIEIRQQYLTGLWVVDADRGQLEQVLLNLLINADQAMAQGGRIVLETENVEPDARRLRHLSLNPGHYVCISVEDSGVGMDQEVQGRIFEPFFTTKEVGRGTGLGLASAYGIIKNHGGTIDVESAPGRGSRFFVYLPASDGHVALENEIADGIIMGRGTILIVDDEQIVLDVSSQLLERLGYRAIIAEDGNQAETIYRQRHSEIDMVILDMIMPVVSGVETYGRLKKINPGIKVLLSSGYSQKDQAGEIIARDHQEFVQKPFDLAQLSRKIARVLTKT